MNGNNFNKFLAIAFLIAGIISNGIGVIVNFIKNNNTYLSNISVLSTIASLILIVLLGVIFISSKNYMLYSYIIVFITAFISFPIMLISSPDAVFIFYLIITAPTFGILSYKNIRMCVFGIMAIMAYYIVFYFKVKYNINMYNDFMKINFMHIAGGLIASYLFMLSISTLLVQVVSRINKELNNKAILDPLTKAKNRNMLSASELENSGILMIDIDHFKRLNDEFGHTNGDESLKFLVKTIRKCIRGDDEIIRYGGEEFIVVLKGLKDILVVKDIAETIRCNILYKSKLSAALKKPFTISIGATIYKNNLTLDENIKIVDSMLYAAKHNGRNQTFCNEIVS